MGRDRVERECRRISRRKTLIESQIESLNFIGGEWVPADSGETLEIVNPSNPSEVLGTTPRSDKEETERAVEAAAEALPDWKATLPPARGAILM
jgi:alpha-ketoglutaric semialdehyde dehydrogenase